MDFYEKLKKICNEHGTTVSGLEKTLGFSNASLSKGTPRADRLYKIAEYFDLPMEYFLDDSEQLDDYYNKIHEQLTNYLRGIEKPVYRASAGEGAYNDTYTSDSITMGEDGYEYVEIVGNSMSPILEDGDIVTVELTTEVSPHDLAVVKIDGETACVKYCEITDHGIWLKAENKSVYEDRFYSISQVLTLPITVLGRVIELRRKIQ